MWAIIGALQRTGLQRPGSFPRRKQQPEPLLFPAAGQGLARGSGSAPPSSALAPPPVMVWRLQTMRIPARHFDPRQHAGGGGVGTGPAPQLINVRHSHALRGPGLADSGRGDGGGLRGGGSQRQRTKGRTRKLPPLIRALEGSGRCAVLSSRLRQGPAQLSGEGPGGTGSAGPGRRAAKAGRPRRGGGSTPLGGGRYRGGSGVESAPPAERGCGDRAVPRPEDVLRGLERRERVTAVKWRPRERGCAQRNGGSPGYPDGVAQAAGGAHARGRGRGYSPLSCWSCVRAAHHGCRPLSDPQVWAQTCKGLQGCGSSSGLVLESFSAGPFPVKGRFKSAPPHIPLLFNIIAPYSRPSTLPPLYNREG